MLWGHQLGKPEVQDFYQPVIGDHHVLGLQIPMNNPRLMGFRQSLRHLPRVANELIVRERTVRENLPKRLPLHILHRNEGSALVFTDLVDRDDVGMVQRRGSTGFLLESTETAGVSGHLLRQDFDGDVST